MLPCDIMKAIFHEIIFSVKSRVIFPYYVEIHKSLPLNIQKKKKVLVATVC